MDASNEKCCKNIVAGSPDMTVATAAKVMRAEHAGAIVVVDDTHARLAPPVGLVTDRDLVVHAVALGLDLKTITVGDLGELLENRGSHELVQVMERLKSGGVRHIPVIDAQGRPAALLSIDEMLALAVPVRAN